MCQKISVAQTAAKATILTFAKSSVSRASFAARDISSKKKGSSLNRVGDFLGLDV